LPGSLCSSPLCDQPLIRHLVEGLRLFAIRLDGDVPGPLLRNPKLMVRQGSWACPSYQGVLVRDNLRHEP
jgi:hypothetical protein